MQITNLFKKFFYSFLYILFISTSVQALSLQKTSVILDAPWGMTWFDENHLLITQKSGEIFKVNIQDFSQTPILSLIHISEPTRPY